MKILTLDDHPIFSSGLKTSLNNHEHVFNVISTLNTQDALNYLQKHSDIDLFIVDLSMPEMNGLSFIQLIIARKIYTPVVIMSATEDLTIIEEAFKLGVLGFIPKSWTINQIADALKLIQQGGTIVPEHIANALSFMSKKASKITSTSLSKRQLEILKLVSKGLSNKGIASILNISEVTIKSHLQTTFKIIGASSRMDCVCKAEHLNILY